MERRQKVLRTTSNQEGASCSETALTSLPEEVAHQILSDLNVVELIRMTCVSKLYKSLYLSVPVLNIDLNAMPGKPAWFERTKLLNHLDKLLLRRRDNKIKRFRVCWFLKGINASICDEHVRVIDWIYIAVRCNAEEIDLQLSLNYKVKPTVIELPEETFTCPSLWSLQLDLKFCVLETPSVLSCTNLRSLVLRSVIIEDGFLKWVTRSCHCLNKLTIDGVLRPGNVIIDSSSLESVHFVFVGKRHQYKDIKALTISGEKLHSVHIEHVDLRSSACRYSLKIVAPDLRYLSLAGNIARRLTVEKFTHVEEAVMFLNPADDGGDKVFEIVRCILGAKVIRLNTVTLMAVFKHGEGAMSGLFDDISDLFIHTKGLDNEIVPALDSILTWMPSLNALHMKYEQTRQSKSTELTRASLVRKFKAEGLFCIRQLKQATLEISHGHNELVLAKYLLEEAKELNKLVLEFSGRSYTPNKLNQLLKKLTHPHLKRVVRIHSTATVVFEAEENHV